MVFVDVHGVLVYPHFDFANVHSVLVVLVDVDLVVRILQNLLWFGLLLVFIFSKLSRSIRLTREHLLLQSPKAGCSEL